MRQWTIDAFATAPFRGNQACVVAPFDQWPSSDWMQALASENNQAETAFLRFTADPARFDLRWFTPLLEVPLCGHATLAAAHVLFAELGLQAPEVIFETLSGELRVSCQDGTYAMDFPAAPPVRIPAPAGLAAALGLEPAEVWASTYLVAILDSEAAVRELAPDIPALNLVSSAATGGRGDVVVAALGDGNDHDVVSRFFAPGSGIPEDPATGSAHCILAPLFADRLGRARNRFHQAYPGRGGDLDCELVGDRVLLRGKAFTVLDGQLRLEPR
jgi:PhzF family phenazine biosynthesis protein